MKPKILVFLAAALFCLAASAMAATSTATLTATETATFTASQTHTNTPTITQTATITPTFTNSPTPQAETYAYPNPAAYRDDMFIAYPSKTGSAADFKRVIILIYAANGDFVDRVIDDYPNGYTGFDISRFSRGMYAYRLTVRYQDGTEDVYGYKKFTVIK